MRQFDMAVDQLAIQDAAQQHQADQQQPGLTRAEQQQTERRQQVELELGAECPEHAVDRPAETIDEVVEQQHMADQQEGIADQLGLDQQQRKHHDQDVGWVDAEEAPDHEARHAFAGPIKNPGDQEAAEDEEQVNAVPPHAEKIEFPLGAKLRRRQCQVMKD